MVGERGERGEEEGVALGEDVFERGLEEKAEGQVGEGAGEIGEDVLVWRAVVVGF